MKVEEEPVNEENPNLKVEVNEENPNQSLEDEVNSFENLFLTEQQEEIVEENIEPQVEEENKPEEPQREPKKLSYVNRNGNGIQINRF